MYQLKTQIPTSNGHSDRSGLKSVGPISKSFDTNLSCGVGQASSKSGQTHLIEKIFIKRLELRRVHYALHVRNVVLRLGQGG